MAILCLQRIQVQFQHDLDQESIQSMPPRHFLTFISSDQWKQLLMNQPSYSLVVISHKTWELWADPDGGKDSNSPYVTKIKSKKSPLFMSMKSWKCLQQLTCSHDIVTSRRFKRVLVAFSLRGLRMLGYPSEKCVLESFCYLYQR